MADQEKDKFAIIGELVVNVANLSNEEAQRISDIVFGMNLVKTINGGPTNDNEDKKGA